MGDLFSAPALQQLEKPLSIIPTDDDANTNVDQLARQRRRRNEQRIGADQLRVRPAVNTVPSATSSSSTGLSLT